MLLLLAIPTWLFLVAMTLALCAAARRGDLEQTGRDIAEVERSPRLALPDPLAEQGRPSAGDTRRVAA